MASTAKAAAPTHGRTRGRCTGRVNAAGAVHLQGDAINVRTLPELTAHIVGSAPLKRVVVVRDNQVVYSQEPVAVTYDLRFRETSLTAGEHFYYVRAEQADGNVAWSSPVWVNYTNP